MSATDELRSLLDERGVEWLETTSCIGATITDEGIERHYLVSTWWNSPVFGRVEATDMGDGVLHMACLNGCDFTPEQAIAVTLGREILTADDVRDLTDRHSDASGGNGRDFHNGAYVAIADELNATLGSCNCSNNCTNSERTRACLPHFWTHDGVLHVELPKLPESISVRLPDQRDREVGSAMVWQYTRDRGTCHECADMDKEIVRCRDCKFYTPESMTREERMFGVYENVWEPGGCFNPSRCSSTWDNIKEQMVPVGIDTEPDGFCAWGERKEVDE